MVLLLEDLHWADEGSLEFLKFLLEVNTDMALLIVGLARPTLFERRSDIGPVGLPHRRIILRELDEGHSRELADELLQRLAEVPPALVENCVGQARPKATRSTWRSWSRC